VWIIHDQVDLKWPDDALCRASVTYLQGWAQLRGLEILQPGSQHEVRF